MCAQQPMVWASRPWLQLMSMSSVSYYCFRNISRKVHISQFFADSPEVSLHQQYQHSAADKGITIKIDCVAHGNPSPQVCDTFAELETIEEELRCNIFLRAKDLKTFSKLRDLKDNF